MTAVFAKGNQEMIDYTPGSDVAAGNVVLQTGLAGVALRKQEANRQGALCISGQFDVDTDLSGTAVGTKVDVNTTTQKAVADGAGDGALGVTVASPANGKVRVSINQASGH